MIRMRRGVVIALGAARPGAHELDVDIDGERATAIAYPELCDRLVKLAVERYEDAKSYEF